MFNEFKKKMAKKEIGEKYLKLYFLAYLLCFVQSHVREVVQWIGMHKIAIKI